MSTTAAAVEILAERSTTTNIVVGVLGAFLGGFLLSFAFDTASGGWFFTFLTALLGAVILLAIVKAVTKRR